MKRKYKSVLVIAPILVLTFALFALPSDTIVVFASPAWSADSYGNTLLWVYVSQNDSGSWVQRGNITDEGTIKIHHGQEVNFTLKVKLNATLVSECTSEYVLVWMNITHENGTQIWSNYNMTLRSNTTVSGFHYIIYSDLWTSNLPEEGVTYNCTVIYKQYY